MDGLHELSVRHPCIETVRGIGLMIGLVLDRPCRPVADALLAAGLLCIPTGDRVLRFVPPLVVTDSEISRALSLLDATLS